MLKKIDKTGKTKTLYICDMCGKMVNMEDRVAIHTKIGTDKSIQKKWDLCNKCYVLLNRSIIKYKKKLERENSERKISCKILERMYMYVCIYMCKNNSIKV